MAGCFYCEAGEALDRLMVPVAELPCAKVFLVRNQNFAGRCVVAFSGHKAELHDLTGGEREQFFASLSLVSKAVCEEFCADKINYAVYGDEVPHFHFHIVPKKRGEFCWGAPFVLQGNDCFLTDEALAGRAEKLRRRIEALR